MIEKLELKCDDGSRAAWEPDKPGDRLSRVHQMDVHMKVDRLIKSYGEL